MADTTTTTYGLTKPEVGASQDTWGGKLNTNFDTLDDLLDGTTAIAPNLTAGSWKVSGTAITATAAELNYVDGVTSAIQTQLDAKAATNGNAANNFSAATMTATTAAVTTVDLGDWTVTESSGTLYFANSGVNKMKIDSSGNLTVVGDITAFGTV